MNKKVISSNIAKFLFFFFIGAFALALLNQNYTTKVKKDLERQTGQFGNEIVFNKAKVLEILDEGERNVGGVKIPFQEVKLEILEGKEKGKKIDHIHGGDVSITDDQKVRQGQTIVLSKSQNFDKTFTYQIADKYRLDNIIIFVAAFVVFVFFISGRKSLGSFIGLAFSFLVIIKFIIPQILDGKDPLLIIIIGSFLILLTTIYLAHGFSKQTTVAVFSTFITLALTGLLAVLFVNIGLLTGQGSEEAYSLRLGPTEIINLKGLLLGGILIGVLGVLDDITTTQAAAVFELAKTDKKLSLTELIKKGHSIGKEHISSLVNTLVLAYTGVSLPIIIFFLLNPNNTPVWVIFNSELVSEEIVRTLAGSFGLVLAVPIATILAAFVAVKENIKVRD